ncbi:(2Fe-2S)-binding protein [Methylomonas sp. AM2-LC]|uniref:(2Fe-2S)-binding protein n=1 Tax=Methylomonas sp. AM2-LC TaxID=3153301 RepID=UPI003263A81B
MIEADSTKDVICTCSGTTRIQVLELIANGNNTLDRISRITGACSGCGACDTDIIKLLEIHHPN